MLLLINSLEKPMKYNYHERYRHFKVKFKQYQLPYSFEVVDSEGTVLNCPFGVVVPKPNREDAPAPFNEATISFQVRNKYGKTIEIERITYHEME
jgi:hypothetical protein